MHNEEYKSPRKEAEEKTLEKRADFEQLMEMADDPKFPMVTREIAFRALKENKSIVIVSEEVNGRSTR